MTYTFDANIVSDLHKDARGYRPSEYWWDMWNDADNAGKQKIWDDLCDEHEEEMKRYDAAQDKAWENLLERIQTAYSWGAKNKVQALRWIMESEEFDEFDLQYGESYFAYHFGLAYSKVKDLPIREAINEMVVDI